MRDRFGPNRILSVGTKVVTRAELRAAGASAPLPAGSVGVVVSAATDPLHTYRVRFANHIELTLRRSEFSVLREVQTAGIERPDIVALREGVVPVRVEEHREQLLAIRRGQLPWDDVERWRLALHGTFEAALAETKLPERPDYERVNAYLIRARRSAAMATPSPR